MTITPFANLSVPKRFEDTIKRVENFLKWAREQSSLMPAEKKIEKKGEA